MVPSIETKSILTAVACTLEEHQCSCFVLYPIWPLITRASAQEHKIASLVCEPARLLAESVAKRKGRL
jgi:hypothetical protein